MSADETVRVEHITVGDMSQASNTASDAIRKGAISVSICAGPRRDVRVTIIWGEPE